MSFQALLTRETENGYENAVEERELADLGEEGVLVRVHWSSLNYKDALSATASSLTRRGLTRWVWWRKPLTAHSVWVMP